MACLSLSILMLHISIYTSATLFTLCEARSDAHMMKFSDAQLYSVSSPFALPPFESVAPASWPENTPPFGVFAPITPQPPSSTAQSPLSYAQPPGPTPPIPDFPFQSPPSIPINVPSPPTHSPVPNPPEYERSPPRSFPSPPNHVPSPPNINFPPSPPIFLPPVVFPPPSGPPPPANKKPEHAMWCVAKPAVPDPIIQEAMDYACGTGADCKLIQPDGPCYKPHALLAHASYAFNSYWQNTKAAGGTCDFGGTAMLVSVDPSFDECHFICND
ncbi:hypothetical protein FH972_025139 [Carpinus fangiana]|uniref:X8 domain-containing protein n=1 Tax=Carpinus fangiana TaxID=176857 RepID=A0A5N6L0A9_9ROSI|nr:hypothetical protein FH972_025139 [Carpinus fangiana]